MDYSKTVNLPKTSFSMKGELQKKEPQILDFWEKEAVYEKVKNKNSDSKKFILHDGPPYANGHIHIGHALNKILKDIIVKFKMSGGMHCPYVPGWDCHGLPIEQQLLKELKIEKNQIEPVKFRKKAASFAIKFVEVQKKEFKRLGIFGDWENPYLTLSPYYESAIIDVFGKLTEKNFIYRKKKPVYWCPTCQTALADAEVEYADHISHSIFVKFPVIKLPSTISPTPYPLSPAVIIWTTTPWTLPANVALAFNPEEDYVFLKTDEKEIWILAKKRMQSLNEKLKIKNYEVIAEKKGSDFEGIVCKNPLMNRESKGVLADFVSMEDGSGVVHIAPGHGVDDYQVALKYNLPVISPVDDAGVFTEDANEFRGHKVFAANHLIVEKLQKSGYLLTDEKLTHSYPHCWRCKRAIIFRATEQWFLDVNSSNLKEKLLTEIEKVRWIPNYGKKRISSMVEQRPDWCLSRQRLWGTPIPVFYCESCNKPILDVRIIKSVSKLFKENGSDIWYEKTAADIISLLEKNDWKIECQKCSGTKFRKENDIFDVWFDSGVSSFAVLNKENFKELDFPSDIYLEGSDQHRGWFQTSLIPSVALKNSAPYKIVLTHGFVVDGEGKKMSKSQGNVISPEEIIGSSGADILRLWVAGSDYSEDIRLSKEILSGLVEIYRKIRNTVRYILGNISEFPPTEKISYEKRREIDRFMLYRFSKITGVFEREYELFQFHKVIYHLNNFCVNDLSSFYFDILKDCLYTYKNNSYERRSAQSTLEDIFLCMEKYIAPILPFTAEDAWKSYKNDRNLNVAESVFLFDFSDLKNCIFDETRYLEILRIWEIRNLVNYEIEKLRVQQTVGSSLECEITIAPGNEEEQKLLEKYANTLSMVFIVSKVIIKKPLGKETIIEVQKSNFNKCSRCWNYREDVSKNPEKLDVCSRCYSVIK